MTDRKFNHFDNRVGQKVLLVFLTKKQGDLYVRKTSLGQVIHRRTLWSTVLLTVQIQRLALNVGTDNRSD